MNDPGAALEYHRATVHDPSGLRPDHPLLVRGYRPLQPARRPPQFKTYEGLEAVRLPEDLSVTAHGTLDLSTLSWLLFFSAGVVRVMEAGGEPMWFRAAGSAGNLSPVEVYVVTGELPGLDAGVYHFEPVEHALTRLRPAPVTAPPCLVLTGVPWRTAWKYRERGFRHLYWDAGTMLAQTLALAEEAGLAASVEMGFVDHVVAESVGADGVHELPLAIVPLTEESAVLEPETVPSGHLADDPLEFPLITEAQRAGELADDGDVEAWRQAAAGVPADTATAAGPGLLQPAEVAVRRRGSTRRFDPSRSAPAEVLSGAMAWATRAVPGDFVGDGKTLLEHNVAVHGVDGFEPGAYRWAEGELHQLRAGDLRHVASHLCLGQDLGGAGSYTAFHCARLEPVLAVLGSRGYRAVQLEAGIAEGRLHLFAFDREFGATGLTFYDHEVSRFFHTEAVPMLVTAVGAPAYRSKPGGLPRRPTRLRPA